jgi:paraquat-inducible protein A
MSKRVTSLRLARPKDYATPAVLVLASGLLVLGMYMPLLKIEKMLFWENRYSVVTGVFGLADDGQYVLAIVVFFWSVIFPIAKLALLYWLWFGRTDSRQRSSVLRVLDKLGKWSMLDVYIVAVMIVALKLGPLAEVTVEPGFYYFGGAVVLSMLIGARIEKIARDSGDPALDD